MNINNVNSVYKELEIIIENGMKEIMNKNLLYQDINIIVSNEQQFIKVKEQRDKQTIYIVIQYGQATVHYGQTVMPYTLTVLSEKNRLSICQQLLYDYAIAYNMTHNIEKTIFQTCETPRKSLNFQLLYEGFTSVFNTRGNFIISETANFYGLYYHLEDIKTLKDMKWNLKDRISFKIDGEEIKETVFWEVNFASDRLDYSILILTPNKEIYVSNGMEEEAILIYKNVWINEDAKNMIFFDGKDIENKNLIQWLEINDSGERVESVDFLNSAFKCDFVPDTQAFYHRKNFTHSINKFANLAFSVVLYTTEDSPLVNDILRIITKKGDINKSFKFTIHFLKKHALTDNFKLINVSADQQIGDMTMFVLTFTN